jgi:hypothetical protein
MCIPQDFSLQLREVGANTDPDLLGAEDYDGQSGDHPWVNCDGIHSVVEGQNETADGEGIRAKVGCTILDEIVRVDSLPLATQSVPGNAFDRAVVTPSLQHDNHAHTRWDWSSPATTG